MTRVALHWGDAPALANGFDAALIRAAVLGGESAPLDSPVPDDRTRFGPVPGGHEVTGPQPPLAGQATHSAVTPTRLVGFPSTRTSKGWIGPTAPRRQGSAAPGAGVLRMVSKNLTQIAQILTQNPKIRV